MNLEDLGVEDPQNFKWQDFALCKDMPIDWFFEEYEKNTQHARVVDSMCEVCPVRAACEQFGNTTAAFGVQGGIYMQWGKPDKQKNKHKTRKVWKALGHAS